MPDAVEQAILADGHILINNFSHKWLLSQMFRHQSFDIYFVKNKPYDYTWTTTLKQIKMMSHLTSSELKSQERFFNFHVVNSMLDHYLASVGKEERQLASKFAEQIRCAKTYEQLAKRLKTFIQNVKLPGKLPKSQAWIVAFKNFGAYTTIKELIMFYNCRLFIQNAALTTRESLLLLETEVNKKIKEPDALYKMLLKFADDNKNELIRQNIMNKER